MAGAVRPIEDRRLLGIGLVLVAFFCFAVIDSCAKWLTQHGLPPLEVAFVRYVGQLLLVVALFAPTHGAELVRTRRPLLELVRGLCLLGQTVFNFLAITYIPLTVTAAISFASPLILCGLSGPLLGERVGWQRWLAIVLGFVGVLVITRPGTDAFHPAMLLSLAAASSSALYFILTRKLAGVDTATAQQFYAAAVATGCLLPFGFGNWVWPAALDTWVPFVLIGVVALAGHQAITIAHRFAPASTLAPFNYVLILYLSASSWLIFQQPPDAWTIIGAAVVIGAGLFIWVRERQLQRAKSDSAAAG